MKDEYNKYTYDNVKKFVNVVEHASLVDKLTRLRDRTTESPEVRKLVNEISLFVAYEATNNLPLREVKIWTPMCEAPAQKLKYDVVLAPVMRAGLAMEESIHTLFPRAPTAHFGCFRDEETFEPQKYFCKSPEAQSQILLILDPMLATGGSMLAAIEEFKQRGYRDIRALSIISVPYGIMRIHQKHPDVKIYTCAVDKGLDENAYIVPGAGDLGDRIYGAA